MADWDGMKAAYVSGGMSYRQISEQFGTPASTIRKRGATEHWAELRNKVGTKAEQKIIDAVSDQRAEVGVSIYQAADRLLGKVVDMLDGDMSAKDVRALTAALKDLKDIKDVRSDADIREQEARIEKLRRDSQVYSDDEDETGVIMLPPVLEADQ